MHNLIAFPDLENVENPNTGAESATELKRRILSEYRRKAWGRPGRRPSGRVTHYLICRLEEEGRSEEAERLKPLMTWESKASGEIKYSSEEGPHARRYRARKEREREGRELLRSQAEKTKAERNEEVRFCVSGEILQKAEEVAKESGLSVGEMCRVILASIAGNGVERRMGPAQAVYPFWRTEGRF